MTSSQKNPLSYPSCGASWTSHPPQQCKLDREQGNGDYRNTITHKKMTELIPKQFQFNNSSTKNNTYNSQNNSARASVTLCSHFLPRPSNSRNISVRQSQSKNYDNDSKLVKFGSVISLHATVIRLEIKSSDLLQCFANVLVH